MKGESVRCGASWDIPWKGHASSLKRKRCKRKTKHPSQLCHTHRPNMNLKRPPMTPSLQIAVAKEMGWKHDFSGPLSSEYWKDRNGHIHDQPPPLTLDLMWEAEEMLGQRDCDRYQQELMRVFDDVDCPSGAKAYLWHLTSEQRAKAWLKVKGVEL